MKRTPLKRSTKSLKRSPIKHKAKRYPISKAEIEKVMIRSGGMCESCGRVLGCQISHIVHRRMGGVQSKNAHIINEHRNMAYLCLTDHCIIDGKIQVKPADKMLILERLKDKIDWYSWQKEFGVKVKDE